jgi:hypothetical protein
VPSTGREQRKSAHAKRHNTTSHLIRFTHAQSPSFATSDSQHPRRESAFQTESPKNRKSTAKLSQPVVRASLSRSRSFIFFFPSRKFQIARDFIPLQNPEQRKIQLHSSIKNPVHRAELSRTSSVEIIRKKSSKVEGQSENPSRRQTPSKLRRIRVISACQRNVEDEVQSN